jgi:DNA invertase Pin-like site-specific DNA recombinase
MNACDLCGSEAVIVAEYRDDGTTASLPKLLEESGAEVLLCTDVDRLGRQITPEVFAALRNNGARVVTVAEGEIGVADLISQAMKGHIAKTESQQRSARIKQESTLPVSDGRMRSNRK